MVLSEENADVKQCASMLDVRVKRESRVPSWFEELS